MGKTRVFTSFDMDHDEDLRNLLIGQSKNPESPFEIADYSLRDPLSGNWQEKVRSRIRSVNVVCVICGVHTDTASGVSVELQIAKDERIPYFLLKGRSDKYCVRPNAASSADKIYDWTWPNLKALIGGAR